MTKIMDNVAANNIRLFLKLGPTPHLSLIQTRIKVKKAD